jgi:hypothetical protein
MLGPRNADRGVGDDGGGGSNTRIRLSISNGKPGA